MRKGYTYALLILPIIILSLAAGQFALAANDFEVNYPNLPFGDIALNSGSTLPQFIAYVFYFFITISGIIGVIAIVVGGFEFLASAGNETLISDAKDRIRSAVFGIILLFCIFILVRTINPDLINLRSSLLSTVSVLPNGTYIVTPLPGGVSALPNSHNTFGIPYANAQDSGGDEDCEEDYDCEIYGDWEWWLAPIIDPDTDKDDIHQESNSYIIRECDDNSIETFQIYYQKGHVEDSRTRTVDLACNKRGGGIISMDGVKSFKRRVRTPGIYFYSESDCADDAHQNLGDSSYEAITTTQDMPDDFLDMKSLKIINSTGNSNPEDDIYWGLVVNAAGDFRGECSQPAINITKSDICVSVDLKFIPQFINVFHWNPKYDNKKNYQNGLTIYGLPIEIEAPPAGTGDGATGATCYASSDCTDGLTCGCLGGAPCGTPDEPAGTCEPRSGDQDYYYIAPDKIQNHWYYVQEGYAEHKSGYFTQAYYNISAQEIINKINQSGKGYYACFNDPGLLLKDGAEACDAGNDPGGDNVCEVVDPPAPDSQKNCLIPNSPYCIQSLVSRDKYLYMLYAQNENGDNRTCSIFAGDTTDLQEIDFMENGKELYRLNIIPVK